MRHVIGRVKAASLVLVCGIVGASLSATPATAAFGISVSMALLHSKLCGRCPHPSGRTPVCRKHFIRSRPHNGLAWRTVRGRVPLGTSSSAFRPVLSAPQVRFRPVPVSTTSSRPTIPRLLPHCQSDRCCQPSVERWQQSLSGTRIEHDSTPRRNCADSRSTPTFSSESRSSSMPFSFTMQTVIESQSVPPTLRKAFRSWVRR